MNTNFTTESQFHEQIGRFCVEFEQVCHAMEACIRNILVINGLKNPRVQEVLLSGYTAEPLRALMQNLLGEVLVMNDNERNLCTKALSKIQELIDKRNNLLHSKWFLIGQMSSSHETEILALGQKLHSNKSGAATKHLQPNLLELKELISICREAYTIVSLITRCVLRYRTLAECFEIKSKKLMINQQALMPVSIDTRTIKEQ